MTIIRLNSRVLFLSNDPEVVERQLQGENLALVEAGALRDNISTDEITPATVAAVWDERLGRYPYLGFVSGGRCPIGIDAVKNGGFAVTVAGKRYGKGSSREHSPMSERAAGIRLVVAESFERIYRQNADNLGLFTSTDFSLIERVQNGEPIDIEELVASRDAQAAAILRHGGLLRYGRERMKQISLPPANTSSSGSRTLVEKIIASHLMVTGDSGSGLKAGSGAFVRPDWRFLIEYYTPMCAHMLHAEFGRPLKLHDPQSVRLFEDHTSYVHRSIAHTRAGLLPAVQNVVREHRKFGEEYGLIAHGLLADGVGSEGISHPMMSERYALPGQIIVGTDSHTTHSGALGCLAFGVGSTEMANALVTGLVRITVPASLRVELAGRLPTGVSAKDVVLHLLADPRIRAGSGVGKVFEFAGPVIAQLSTDERATLTNMTAELGGFTGIVAPDQETVRFLRERRGIDFQLQDWMCSDAEASYAEIIQVDCSALAPMVARPGDPGNGVPVTELSERPKVDIAYGGSCTGGKREDFDSYHQVLSWAVNRGLRVHPGVKLYLQFGTIDVRDYCVEKGYLDVFERAGAEMLQPSCGACVNGGPGTSEQASEVTVSAINRNFPGRCGPGKVWLASPATVVASALAGELAAFAEVQARAEAGPLHAA
ncbi:3-isopropylmalate/(R)-2-methylmalate dehydratase large subunit [Variovorax sp. YR266]|uniref:aconitase family protein n=1 Tax=Variovorax sp. YR266 TaxID=1884386 RepID=UPI00089A7774|nr:aconitase family protein [Variovorax sp. YR266]SDZ70728.1 3-isopropylmalate/(R)-2-methylmalate dehydratase large subunit [Variovorax sp. YR266]